MNFEAKEVLVTQGVILLTAILGILFQIYRDNRDRKWRKENEKEALLHWNKIEDEFQRAKPVILLSETDAIEFFKHREKISSTLSSKHNHESINDKRTE